ncbi:MAG: AAA family ATPase [Myxococcota bacterium]
MPSLQLEQPAVILPLDEDFYVGILLQFPQLSTIHTSPEKVLRALRSLAESTLKNLSPAEVWKYVHQGEVQLSTVPIRLPPPASHDTTPRAPIELSVPVASWQAAREPAFVQLLLLNDETVSARLSELPKLLPGWILSTLQRHELTRSWTALGLWERLGPPELHTVSLCVELLDARSRKEQEDQGEAQPPVMPEATLSWRELEGGHPACFEVEEELKQLQQRLNSLPRRSFLLVGPSGVGKTARVVEVARREEHRRGKPFIRFTSGARLIAGTAGSIGDWQEKCQRLLQEAGTQGIVLHLGSLLELTEVGKAEGHTQSLAHYFLPAIAKGEVQCIFECTAEELGLLERNQPRLVEALERIQVEQPSLGVAGKILVAEAERMSEEVGVMPEALALLERLVRRYGVYSVWPGWALRLLRSLQRQHLGDLITVPAVLDHFSRVTGLPRFLLDERAPFDRDHWRAWLAARVLGQAEPIEAVLDVLATLKAGLNRPHKPLASLFFLGPTGVGKTQLARSLAELIFQGYDRLLRFDMSEFSNPLSVQRLVGGLHSGEGLLTGKVREQPFSVLLFDEVEKADPSFFDLLLQVLGEGRLTDARGQRADFTNTIVVMTSNLGVSTFQTSSVGFGGVAGLEQRAAQHFIREVEKSVRPELFNRLDRILPFAPLSREHVRALVVRELALLPTREGLRQRQLSLSYAPELVEFLLERGFDPRYGARPLKRAIEQLVLPCISDRLLDTDPPERGYTLHLSLKHERVKAECVPPPGMESRGSRGEQRRSQAAEGSALSKHRLRQQYMLNSSGVGDLRSELLELNRVLNRKRARHGQPLLTPEQHRQESLKAARLAEYLESLQTLLDAFLAHELALLLEPEGDVARDLAVKELLLDQQEEQLTYLLDRGDTQSEHALVLMLGEPSILENMGALFLEFLPLLELKANNRLLYRLTRRGAKKSKEPLRLPSYVCLHTPEHAEVLLFSHDKSKTPIPDSELTGCIVEARGKRAQLYLKLLMGTWCWTQARQKLEMQVSLEQGALERLELTRHLGRRKKGDGGGVLTLNEVDSVLDFRFHSAELTRNNRLDMLKKMFDVVWEQFIFTFLRGE